MSLEPGFDAFAAGYDAGLPQLVWTRLIDDLETPVSAYLKIGHGRPYAFLFESVEGGAWRGRYSIVAMKPDVVWRCRGDQAEIARDGDIAAGRFTPLEGGALDSLRDLIAQSKMELPAGLPPMAAGIFGALGYDTVRLVEKLPDINPDALGLPDGIMTRPSIVAVFDAIAQEIVLTTTARPTPGVSAKDAYAAARERIETVMADLRRPLAHDAPRVPQGPMEFTTPVSREDYREVVEKAKEYIRAGDIFQVVPSHRFRAPFGLDAFALYRSLRRTNPSPFLFFLDLDGFNLVGSSPEILVRLRDGKITIRPIAGTRPRGATPEEDLALEKELLADPKERSEHLMLLDLGRNDVGRVAMLGQAGSNGGSKAKHANVRVTDSFTIERYSHVMHIVSNVEGDAPQNVDPVDVLMAALPAGTLSGAPKVRAMEIIDELEVEKRGIGYAGAVGYIGADGSVDTCIVLRTALVKDGMMYVQAGGGVVADSDADAEYDETLHKSRALKRAAEEAWRFA
ncbi:anthranilate synthase component I [Caulobacter sp. D4A]|uniref:anthranilate synthase component I n=1 Tax=unclassified Caulobacter TaxID=2648921 RepID=UPI000D72CFB3|nr:MULTISPECIES: anthranilate synthase component I [unclassified Caulobacter]PXA73342.1 anthranilate synthase component I [Caulobacter sp. D4A]PXA89471.1 anthranilate synthase component I [Caulobacter sp. D5]